MTVCNAVTPSRACFTSSAALIAQQKKGRRNAGVSRRLQCSRCDQFLPAMPFVSLSLATHSLRSHVKRKGKVGKRHEKNRSMAQSPMAGSLIAGRRRLAGHHSRRRRPIPQTSPRLWERAFRLGFAVTTTRRELFFFSVPMATRLGKFFPARRSIPSAPS